MTSRRSSGSSCVDSEVEPTRSQNITVSWRRSAAVAGRGAAVGGVCSRGAGVRRLASAWLRRTWCRIARRTSIRRHWRGRRRRKSKPAAFRIAGRTGRRPECRSRSLGTLWFWPWHPYRARPGTRHPAAQAKAKGPWSLPGHASAMVRGSSHGPHRRFTAGAASRSQPTPHCPALSSNLIEIRVDGPKAGLYSAKNRRGRHDAVSFLLREDAVRPCRSSARLPRGRGPCPACPNPGARSAGRAIEVSTFAENPALENLRRPDRHSSDRAFD